MATMLVLAIIGIILIFAALVFVHELGHFVMAKRRGVTVEEFGFGFPPRVWGKRVGETIYSINLLPLGGFVRMRGEDQDDTAPGTFGGATLGSKTAILLAGVGMNLVTAIIIFIILCWTGLPDIGGFTPGWLAGHDKMSPRLLVVQVDPGSPADKAGLKYGDYVLAAGGHAITTDTQLYDFTKSHAGQTVTVQVVEHGQTKNLTTTLRPPSAGQGFLGIATQAVHTTSYGWWQGIVAGIWITFALAWATIAAIVGLIIHIPALIIGLFGSSVPAAAQDASGPVGIVMIMKSISVLGPAYIALFVANISVALAAFNVLPIPALDGGRWAFMVVQRLLKRNLRTTTEAVIHLVGFAALIGLMIIITVYDIRKFF